MFFKVNDMHYCIGILFVYFLSLFCFLLNFDILIFRNFPKIIKVLTKQYSFKNHKEWTQLKNFRNDTENKELYIRNNRFTFPFANFNYKISKQYLGLFLNKTVK